jgi:hypothetical protein
MFACADPRQFEQKPPASQRAVLSAGYYSYLGSLTSFRSTYFASFFCCLYDWNSIIFIVSCQAQYAAMNRTAMMPEVDTHHLHTCGIEKIGATACASRRATIE